MFLCNYVYFYKNIRNKKNMDNRYYSLVPFVCPILLLVGIRFAPETWLQEYGFIILSIIILDIGTLNFIILIPELVIMYIKER